MSTSIPLMLSRLLSSSHSSDVRATLSDLADSFSGSVPDEVDPVTNLNRRIAQRDELHELAQGLFQNRKFTACVCSLLTSCTLPKFADDSGGGDNFDGAISDLNNGEGIHIEEGSTCAANLLLSIICPQGTLQWETHQLSTLTTQVLKSSPITPALLDMLYDPVNVQHDIVARTTCVSLMTSLHASSISPSFSLITFKLASSF